jgi:hypothetical protein
MNYLVLKDKEETVSAMCIVNVCGVNCSILTTGCIIRL